jgi:hypothetical protein
VSITVVLDTVAAINNRRRFDNAPLLCPSRSSAMCTLPVQFKKQASQEASQRN